jgi:hypothetical protein
MNPSLVLAMALLLSGCGMLGATAPNPGAALPDQAFCEQRAESDPAVEALRMKGLGNPNFAIASQQQLRLAKQDAVVACLRSRGIIPPGGVERQKPI